MIVNQVGQIVCGPLVLFMAQSCDPSLYIFTELQPQCCSLAQFSPCCSSSGDQTNREPVFKVSN